MIRYFVRISSNDRCSSISTLELEKRSKVYRSVITLIQRQNVYTLAIPTGIARVYLSEEIGLPLKVPRDASAVFKVPYSLDAIDAA